MLVKINRFQYKIANLMNNPSSYNRLQFQKYSCMIYHIRTLLLTQSETFMQNQPLPENVYLYFIMFIRKMWWVNQIKYQIIIKFFCLTLPNIYNIISILIQSAYVFKQIIMFKGLLILTLVICSTSLQFSMEIQYSSLQCFSHLITESTPFHFKVQADNPQFELSLMFRDGTILIKKQNSQTIKKIDSYAAVTDTYTFCIQNSADRQAFIISFFHGLQLSDINALPKQEDHHLIDKLVDELNKVYQIVRQQALYSKTMNQYNMELQKLVSFKYVGFEFLSITVVLIISFLHYLQIKRVLRTRKVI